VELDGPRKRTLSVQVLGATRVESDQP